ncbi:hypothetical protein TNCV_2059091 [Trichonephila clavipes]|nr:hypothetical protein TNCV_2059091 [Trichonephila clavipes]
MARKKNSANNSRTGIAISTTPERTLSAGMPTLTHLDNHSMVYCMDLSLPASTLSLRPGTPQDYCNGSHSNCQGLLKLASVIKACSIAIDGCHKGINELIQAGLTDPNPIMLENSRVLD